MLIYFTISFHFTVKYGFKNSFDVEPTKNLTSLIIQV